MNVFKKYFFTINVAVVAFTLLAALLLQGHLAYLSQLQHAGRIIALLGKVNQVITLLLVGLLCAIACINLTLDHSRKSKLLLTLAMLLLILTVVAKGKFDNMGTDSMAELFHANSQEAGDFFMLYLSHVNVTWKESLVLLAPLLLAPIYGLFVHKTYGAFRTRDIRLAFMVSAGLYLLVALRFAFPLVESYYTLDYFRDRLKQATPVALAGLARNRTGPNVVVYIGESTSKFSLPLYAEQVSPPDPLRDIRQDLIIYSDVVTAFAHTFPSLYRAFSLTSEPYQEQFMLLRDLKRANSISVLGHFGLDTHWISNQNLVGQWDWNSELFGAQARHTTILSAPDRNAPSMVRKSDKELIAAYKQNADTLNRPDQFMFLHSYAGHGDYCKNLSADEKNAYPHAPLVPPLSQKALFGDLHIDDFPLWMKELDCYGTTLNFIEHNLRTVIDDIRQRPMPIVLIYFSDHGEESFEGTGHDSRKASFRVIDVPFMVYFNDAAKAAYPDMYRAAQANKDKRYSLEWLSDTLLDAAGITSRSRRLLSVFQPDLVVPKRYSLRRTDFWGNQFILAIDDDDAPEQLGLVNQGPDYFEKRRITQEFSTSGKNKICAAQTNSVLKYREATGIFHCAEIDVTIDPAARQLFAYRAPKKNNFLTLEDLLQSAPPFSGQLVLNVANPQPANLELLQTRLNRIFDPEQRQRVTIEIPFPGSVTPDRLRGLAAQGYRLFYSLPAEQGRRCGKNAAAADCARFKQQVAALATQPAVRGIAFDADLLPLVDSLHLQGKLEYSVKDAAVNKGEDINVALLMQSRAYTIPYHSAFNY